MDRPQELPIYSGLIDFNKKKIKESRLPALKIIVLTGQKVQAILGQLNREQAEHTADIIDRMMADQPIH